MLQQKKTISYRLSSKLICLHKINYFSTLSNFTAIIVSTKSLPPPPTSEGESLSAINKWEDRLGGEGRKFASQFQRKLKSLVFFQSINFLWCDVIKGTIQQIANNKQREIVEFGLSLKIPLHQIRQALLSLRSADGKKMADKTISLSYRCGHHTRLTKLRFGLNFEVVLTSLSVDASFHCCSNDIIGGRRYLCRHKSLFVPGVVDTGQK